MKQWLWPVRGEIVNNYGVKGNKGVDLRGEYGAPVKASAGGEVVYSGDGIPGYGNLLIIKQNSSYLTAYAFNKKLLVTTGDIVKAGQAIAEVGKNAEGTPLLHFEIRRDGKPVNPVGYLA